MATKIVDQDWSEQNCSQAQGFSLGSSPRALGLPCSEFLRSSWWKEFPELWVGQMDLDSLDDFDILRCFRVEFFRVQAIWGHAIQEWLKIFWAVHALRSANGAKLNDLLLSFEILILMEETEIHDPSVAWSCDIEWLEYISITVYRIQFLLSCETNSNQTFLREWYQRFCHELNSKVEQSINESFPRSAYPGETTWFILFQWSLVDMFRLELAMPSFWDKE